jgi:DNA-binding HxlR family transcriptional regulator
MADAQVDDPQAMPQVVARDRSSTKLTGWGAALVRYVRSGQPDLTNRQMALMLLVHSQEGPHTVRGLAEQLHVSKPVITRALNKLGTLGLVRRERDTADRRNIFVRRTDKGAEFLDAFAGFVAGNVRDEQTEPGKGIQPAQ